MRLDTVEREVIDRVEEVISGISGVTDINLSSLTASRRSPCTVFEKDIKEATQKSGEISGIRNDLPPRMKEMILTRFDPADLPIVSSRCHRRRHRRRADANRRSRHHAPAARAACIANEGGRRYERELWSSSARDLQASSVSVTQVVQAIQSQNMASPVGV